MDNRIKAVTNTIKSTGQITGEQFSYLSGDLREDEEKELFAAARELADQTFGKQIFFRGLIEFTNYCKNDCYYCGIRCSNTKADRYRLTGDQIADCCARGWELGFRTFVLQGGEDPYYTDDEICRIVERIKKSYPACAVTLSIGEKSYESYLRYFNAGADRYLLRHETANEEHYKMLHPSSMSADNRKRCLYDLKRIGYQVGCGIMVGSPYQTVDHLYEDLLFMKDLQPHMIGIGPFLVQENTPFGNMTSGSVELTLRLLSILRLLFPKVLLPATTALGTADAFGREKGILAGANVLMPNLSPASVREKYLLYDGKICTGEEAAECNRCLRARIEKIGYQVVDDRGDHPDFV